MTKINLTKFEKYEADEAEHCSWQDYEIDLDKDYPPTEFLLAYKGVGLFPRGELIAVTGKAKSGKSYMLALLTSEILRGEHEKGHSGGEFETQGKGLRVLLADTEMSAHNLVGRARRVLSLAGFKGDRSHPNYVVLNLRELNPSDRFEKIEQALKDLSPDLLIVDGVVDLVGDFNDTKESKACINTLLRLSSQYECSIVSVLHENKGSQDTNMRGHLGTELTNKCSEVYAVKRDTSTKQYKVEQTLCRNKPVEGWAFSIDDEGVPCFEIPEIPLSKSEVSDQAELNVLREAFKTGTPPTYTDLISIYGNLKLCGRSTAARHLSKWITRGVLRKTGNVYEFDGSVFY